MEGLSSLSPSSQNSQQSYTKIRLQAKLSIDATIITSLPNGGDDGVKEISLSGSQLSKGLALTAQEILDKLNELLKKKLPNGIQSLKPEEVTPEATADRIVKGITAFFDAYAKQNPNLSSEELLTSFLEKARDGVQRGYDSAYATLTDLGAFDYEGVKEGVEKTKVLIESKLKEWETSKRNDLGIPVDVETPLLAQAGGSLSLVA